MRLASLWGTKIGHGVIDNGVTRIYAYGVSYDTVQTGFCPDLSRLRRTIYQLSRACFTEKDLTVG